MFSDSYWAIFCREVGGVSVTVRRKKFNPNNALKGISFRGATHIIDLDRPAYRFNRKFYYIIDMDRGQKVMTQSEIPVSPKLMDTIMRREIVKQLVAGLGTTDLKMSIIFLILGLGMGVAVGIIVGQMIDLGGTTAAPIVNATG